MWAWVTCALTAVACMAGNPVADWSTILVAPCIAGAVWYWGTDTTADGPGTTKTAETAQTTRVHVLAVLSALGCAGCAVVLPASLARLGAGYAFWTWAAVDCFYALRNTDETTIPDLHAASAIAVAGYGVVAWAAPEWLQVFWGITEAAHFGYLVAHTKTGRGKYGRPIVAVTAALGAWLWLGMDWHP